MPASTTRACWRFALPPLAVHAGAAGARLSITLLRPTVVTVHAGHAFVLHDPVGLTGERLLAALHGAASRHIAAWHAGAVPDAVRWIAVQPPLAAVWRAMPALDPRATGRAGARGGRWRRDAGPLAHRPADGRRPARVAERRLAEPRVAEPRPVATADDPGLPRLLLVSEASHPEALPTSAAADALTRALRQAWALFAITRDGAAGRAEGSGDAGGSGAAPAWRTHLVCRGGRLHPVAAASGAVAPESAGAAPVVAGAASVAVASPLAHRD